MFQSVPMTTILQYLTYDITQGHSVWKKKRRRM